MFLHRGLAIAALFVALPAVASDHQHGKSGQPTVAVIFTAEVNLEPAEADRLGDGLAHAIERVYSARAVPASQIRRMVPNIDPACASNPECGRNIGNRLGAGFLLFVSAVKLGGQVSLDPVWVCSGCGAFALRSRVLLPASPSPQDLQRAVADIVPLGELQARAPERKGRQMSTVGWVATGAAAVLAATSAGFGLWSLSRANDCEDAPGCTPDEERAVVTDVDNRNLTADIFLGASVAAAITAGVLYYISDSDGDDEMAVGVTAGSGSVGLTFGGAF